MAKKSRDKGKRGEREARDAAIQYWSADQDKCRRSAQSCGTFTADILDALPGGHVECKLYARIPALDFLLQAEADAGPTDLPIVLMREDGDKEWVVMFRMYNSSRFAASLEKAQEESRLRSIINGNPPEEPTK